MLPDVRQRRSYTCGRVAALVACRHFGVPCPWVPATPLDGTDPRTLENVLARAGLRVQVGAMAVDDLGHHTRLGRLVLCLVRLDGVGHWVVVHRSAAGRVHFHCPAEGPASLPAARFEARWRDRDRWGLEHLRFGLAVWR